MKAVCCWILIPLAIFLVGELAIRNWKVYGDSKGLPALALEEVDILFLGNSRVAAGIDADQFREKLQKRGGEHLSELKGVVNGGYGSTTMFQYLFALKALENKQPGALQGSYVLMEAPNGIGSWNNRGAWTYNDFDDRMLAGLLNDESFDRLWSDSDYDLESKLRLSVLHGFQDSDLYTKRYYFRIGLFRKMTKLIENNVINRVNKEPSRSVKVNIAEAGGIRTDNKAVNSCRNRILKLRESLVSRADKSNQINPDLFIGSIPTNEPDWEKCSLREVVEYVEGKGGEFVFFRMPISSPLRDIYNEILSEDDYGSFFENATSWGADYISVNYQPEDENYPDLLHMNRDARRRFTDELSDSFISYYNEKEGIPFLDPEHLLVSTLDNDKERMVTVSLGMTN